MPNWNVSIGFMTVQVEAPNWLSALAAALPQVGMDVGSLGRLVCAVRDDGTVEARDPVTEMEVRVEPVRGAAIAPPAFQMPAPSFALPEDDEETMEEGAYADDAVEAVVVEEEAVAEAPGPALPALDEAPAAPSLPPAASGAPTDRMESVFLLCGDITAATSVQGACEAALRVLGQLVPSDAGAVLVRTRGGDGLRFAAASGPTAARLLETTIPADQGIAGFAYNFGMGLVIEDAARDVRHYRRVDRSTGYRTRTVLAVPVRSADGARLGCLELLNPPQRFSAEDLEISQMVAASLGEYLLGAGA